MWIKKKYSFEVSCLRFRLCGFCATIMRKDFIDRWETAVAKPSHTSKCVLESLRSCQTTTSMFTTKFNVFVMQFLRCFPWTALKRRKNNDSAVATKKTVNEFGAKISVKSETRNERDVGACGKRFRSCFGIFDQFRSSRHRVHML